LYITDAANVFTASTPKSTRFAPDGNQRVAGKNGLMENLLTDYEVDKKSTRGTDGYVYPPPKKIKNEGFFGQKGLFQGIP
jgi:hypothetical protein